MGCDPDQARTARGGVLGTVVTRASRHELCLEQKDGHSNETTACRHLRLAQRITGVLGHSVCGGGICFEPKWRAGVPCCQRSSSPSPARPPPCRGLQLRRLLRREITVSPSVLRRNREGPQTQAWFLGAGRQTPLFR